MGDVDEGDAPLGADGDGGVRLNIGPLAQHGAQRRHKSGAAVELAGAARYDVPAASGRVVEDRAKILGPLCRAATGHEVVGSGAHQQQIGAVDLGQETVAHSAHGGAQTGVGGPLNVTARGGGQNARDAGHERSVLRGDAAARHQGVPDGDQPQGRAAVPNGGGGGGSRRPVGCDDPRALTGGLGGEPDSAPGDGRFNDRQGTAQPTTGAGTENRVEAVHGERVYDRTVGRGMTGNARRACPLSRDSGRSPAYEHRRSSPREPNPQPPMRDGRSPPDPPAHRRPHQISCTATARPASRSSARTEGSMSFVVRRRSRSASSPNQ